MLDSLASFLSYLARLCYGQAIPRARTQTHPPRHSSHRPKRGRRLVEPTKDRDGFWFGGGNSVRDPSDGSLWLIGRYRDAGDSRTGLTTGPRGRALAIFRSTDNGRSFAEMRTWDKSDLYCGSAVLSIEGSALRLNKRRVQVLVSTEKVRLYPRPVAAFQKPGTGVWSIDAFAATSIDQPRPAGVDCPTADERRSSLSAPQRPPTSQPEKADTPCCSIAPIPILGLPALSGRAVLAADSGESHGHDFFPRGPTWDVAALRITCRLPVSKVGAFACLPSLSLYFYDGAESMHPLKTHAKGVVRPRGYSCEELGGLAYGFDRQFPRLHRLSHLQPLFVSPEGTGCSRYVSVLTEADGGLFATWQRSTQTRSQPLFGHRLTPRRVEALLS